MKYIILKSNGTEVLMTYHPKWGPFGEVPPLIIDDPSLAVQMTKDIQKRTGDVCEMRPIEDPMD